MLTLKNAELRFGQQILLKEASFTIEPGERLCLIGRNGEGKSTLLKIINGEQSLDDGELIKPSILKIGMLHQHPPDTDTITVFDYVYAGLGKVAELLIRYHKITDNLDYDTQTDRHIDELAEIQHQLDEQGGWLAETLVKRVLSRLDLPAEKLMNELSGGWSRRAELARALVGEPDLLLLDEPTNHLDIAAIQWLEDFLKTEAVSLLFISHDRRFIDKVATRIIELDRGIVRSYPGNYSQYLDRKEQELEAEETQEKLFQKKLAQEETWIRQGIKARRTRNEGRVRALKILREENKARVSRLGKAKIELQKIDGSGKLVLELNNVSAGYDAKLLFDDFSAIVMRGDKIALIGPNGVGKSTLLKIMLGKLLPKLGSVRTGTKLDIAYFDQYRSDLKLDKTAWENVADGRQEVSFNGSTRHVLGYLQDFLFTPEKARTPVSALSGGERNRILLAKLFLQPSNLLVLDEPTNDLDMETLELLEERLQDYQGTVLLVSHDRYFIDQVATSCWLFENQAITEITGGYQEIEHYHKQQAKNNKLEVLEKSVDTNQKSKYNKPAKKLSYQLQRELDQLPKMIEILENEIAVLQTTIANPDFYQQDSEVTQEIVQELAEKESLLTNYFQRWEELEKEKNV